MPSWYLPGATCQERNPLDVQDGTLCLSVNFAPRSFDQDLLHSRFFPDLDHAPDLDLSQLLEIMSKLKSNKPKAAEYLASLNSAMREFEINTPSRQVAFLATIAEESTQLTELVENESDDSGPDFVNYDGRNGNTDDGDGKLYRGRGAIQLTGRTNYQNAGLALGVDLENSPDLAADTQYIFRTAGYYWKAHNVNKWADRGDFLRVSYAVNGWPKKGKKRLPNGWALRQKYHRRALHAILGVPDPTAHRAHKRHPASKTHHSGKHHRSSHGDKRHRPHPLAIPPLR